MKPARTTRRRAAVCVLGILGLSGISSTYCFDLPQWERLPPLPDKEGFAGAFAGIQNGSLWVAGVANFPGKKPWDGGQKFWHDTIFALDKPAGEWRVIGKLPRPLAYGVSVTHPRGLICIGGSDASQHYDSAFLLKWTKGQVEIESLPALPQRVANGCGALVRDRIYVAGGSGAPDATTALSTFYSLDLSKTSPAWEELETWPGAGRILATAGARDG